MPHQQQRLAQWLSSGRHSYNAPASARGAAAMTPHPARTPGHEAGNHRACSLQPVDLQFETRIARCRMHSLGPVDGALAQQVDALRQGVALAGGAVPARKDDGLQGSINLWQGHLSSTQVRLSPQQPLGTDQHKLRHRCPTGAPDNRRRRLEAAWLWQRSAGPAECAQHSPILGPQELRSMPAGGPPNAAKHAQPCPAPNQQLMWGGLQPVLHRSLSKPGVQGTASGTLWSWLPAS